MCQIGLQAICMIVIFGHFGLENYILKLSIVQNLCEYCQFFVCDYLGPNCADTLKPRTTVVGLHYMSPACNG